MIHKNTLKSYAPEARKEFIKAITERAAFYGITENKILPCEIKGDFAFIFGRPFPKSIDKRRNDLILRVQKAGFHQTMEEIAYTWFNRFMAIRFMEVNGYLPHGYRVLSHPEKDHNEPEILEKAQFIEKLDGLAKDEILKLKTAVGKESELYRRLIIAQCSDLSVAMPFLFEQVDDPTELLLPDNLLNTDSLVRKIVTNIPEEDWKEVEIVGWLYQFYISERKDELMKAKKVYKTEDIPAVTQLFTPNWIVKYLVQNSLGAKWLGTYPKSALKEKMEYYIAPAEQSDDVKAKIKEITPASLNPEDLTVMDPACGSGHILVEAYDLLKEIYLERGYRARDIAGHILTKNLFGLEIDERAAQLASFALLMKAYADDHEIFKKCIKPNIICLKSGNDAGAHFKEAQELIALFENAKTFGSLIRVPEDLQKNLPAISKVLEKKRSGTMFERGDAIVVEILLKQAEVLSNHYDCVIANPPYMSRRGMNSELKRFIKDEFPDSIWDLFSAFIFRNMLFASKGGYAAYMSPQTWMFLGSHYNLRQNIISQCLTSLVQLSYSGFSGAAVAVCAFSVRVLGVPNYNGVYINLSEFNESIEQAPRTLEAITNRNCLWRYTINQSRFKKIPNSPICYWVKDSLINTFDSEHKIKDISFGESLTLTGDNERFLRYWWEVDNALLGRGKKWIFYAKGGKFRKWYGNFDYVINWSKEAIAYYRKDKTARIIPEKNWYKKGITWSLVTSAVSSFRYLREDSVYDVGGASILVEDNFLNITMAFLNSRLARELIDAVNPSVNLQVGDVLSLPLLGRNEKIESIVEDLIHSAKSDWDSSEMSSEFSRLPLINKDNLRNAFDNYVSQNRIRIACFIEGEKRINEYVADEFSVDALGSDVAIAQITLTVNPAYRYHGKLMIEEQESRFRQDTMKELFSYAVGCMMGRYSLDVSGLVYAYRGNEGFDHKKYNKFPADDDGIIPIVDGALYDDDVSQRFFRFIETVWDKKGLDENLNFIADAIGRRSGESSREAIRRYFVSDFYKDHCQTYKNRPIYWLFTSGKEKAFQALVYLHRYNEGTLARMRTEYVLPLQTKIMRHIDHLEKDKDAASGSSANKIQKEITTLRKQQAELAKFDEKLRHYADMKIKLDLDDGVKANYVKFGELLEPIKGLKHGSEED
jgi:type II restriction/modification system DNA methylase subunit YeeA